MAMTPWKDSPGRKLTWEKVRWIRANYKKDDPDLGAVALAKRFNVGPSTIDDVIRRDTWRE